MEIRRQEMFKIQALNEYRRLVCLNTADSERSIQIKVTEMNNPCEDVTRSFFKKISDRRARVICPRVKRIVFLVGARFWGKCGCDFVPRQKTNLIRNKL